MDSPPESVVALSCELPPTSPTLPSLDHSPLGHHHDSPSSFQVSLFPHEKGDGEGKEISILPSPTPAVALFPGGQDEHGPSPDNSPPETPLDPLSLREALPGFGALELALSSTHDPSCSDELDLQLFHNGRPSGEGSEGGSGDGSGGQPAPPALRFPCKVCGKRFRFNSILSLHARAHSLERDRASFACQQCGFRAPHRAGLAVHLKIHQNQAPEPQNQRQTEAPSVIPPATSENALFLVTGATPSVEEPGPLSSTSAEDPALANSTAFRCHACKGKFRTASELTRHVRILHNPYKCALCPFSASQEEDLASHLRESHPPLSPAQEEKAPPSVAMAAVVAPPPPPAFRCETCGQRFTQSWFLKGHMRKHKDSLDHKCQVCGRGFKEPWFLKNHMKVHLNKLGLKVLGASCSDEQTKAVPGGQALGALYSSLLLARGGAEKAERDALAKLAMVGAGEAGGPSKASLLGYLGLPGDGAGASCMERLAAVAQVAEMGGGSGSGNAAPAGGVGDQAAVWHLVARSLVAAQQAHQQQQQRPRQRQQHRSSVAGEAEQVRAYLGGLASRQDHPDGPWECPDCGKLFRSLQQAVVHARVHAQRPPKGDEGGKQSGSLQPTTGATGGHSAATSHFQANPGENGVRGASPGPPSGPRERVRGAGVKDCPYCGKAFRSSHHLKVHLRVHTGERPYKCPHCDYAGTQSGSLKYHLQRHHREQRSSGGSGGSSSSTPSGGPSRSAALTSSPGASQALLGARQRGSQGPFGRHSQQWQLGSVEHRERKAGSSQRDALADPEGLRYLPGMGGGLGTVISEGGWAGEGPQAKLPKVSRRKPLTTSRMVPTNGRRGSAGPRGRQEGFEPLDLSRRPSHGDGCDEDGGGVTLNQCLFCPFRTSSAELMAMHLQVNHTSKSRRKRGSRGQAWPHREAPRPAAHPELDTLALWKSWRQEADWAASRAVTPNGLSPAEGRPRSALNFTANPSPDLTTPRNVEHERQEDQDEEEEEEIEGDVEADSSSVGDSPRRVEARSQPLHNPFSPMQCEEVFPTEERRSDD